MNSWILVPLIIVIIIDIYAYQSIKLLFSTNNSLQLFRVLFWVLNFVTYCTMVLYLIYGREHFPANIRVPLQGFSIAYFALKFCIVFFLIISDVFRLMHFLLFKAFQKNNTNINVSRSVFLNKMGLVVGAFFFGGLLYGVLRGGYNYTIKRIKLNFKDLHKDLLGLKIVQISDMHLGSFINTNPIEKVVEMINDLNADIFIFTGDLVNEQTKEALPFVDILSKIKAKYGKFSILGNHDYGDYIEWESIEAKSKNLSDLIVLQKKIGWQLLLDESKILSIGEAKLAISGIQYWGHSLAFGKYGNLKKAISNLPANDLHLLLSHDPSHWDAEVSVADEYNSIAATFSGHTHGFQLGIEIPGFIKWSPSQYVYPHWAGLYKKGNQQLYVNRGIGFLGYPGRWGIPPEITVFELA